MAASLLTMNKGELQNELLRRMKVGAAPSPAGSTSSLLSEETETNTSNSGKH